MPSSPKKHNIDETTKRIKCDECIKSYVYKKDLDSHKRIHHSDKNSDLMVAEKKKDKEKEARDKRTAKNIEEKRYECIACKQACGTKQLLEWHMMWIHGDKNDPKVIAFKTEKNETRRKHRGGTVKKTAVPLGSASGSADTGASSSTSIGVESVSSPLGKVALLEKSGCDEVFKRSQHISQHSVDRIGVNIRIASLSSLNVALPNLGLPNLGLPNLGLPNLV